MRKIGLKILMLFFMMSLSGFGEIENQDREYSIEGVNYSLKVVGSNYGTDILLSSLQSTKIITTGIYGENLFPKLFEGKNGYYVTWINYKKENVKLYLYDSCTDSARILISDNFKFIGNPKALYWRGNIKALIFIGLKEKKDDAFVVDLIDGTYTNISNTKDEFEKNFFLSSIEDEIYLNIETNFYKYLYWVNPKNMKFKMVDKEKKENKKYFKNKKSGYTSYNRMVAFGDSITWGKIRMNEFRGTDQNWADVEYHPELTYWHQLEEYFNDNYGNKLSETVSLGVNGDTASNGRDRMNTDFDGVDAYFCMIMFGTNDVTSNTLSMQSTANDIEWMLNNARDNFSMYPITFTIPPQQNNLNGSDLQYYKEKTEELNLLIKQIAVNNNIPCVDTYNTFFEAEEGWRACLEDYKGNHPSPLGHKYIMELIKPIILSLPPKLPVNIKLNSESGDNIVVSWSDNIEFDFYEYEIEYGYYGSQLNRTFNTRDTFRTFYKNYINTYFNSKLNFRIRAVDKSGNKSEFSKVYSFELKL